MKINILTIDDDKVIIETIKSLIQSNFNDDPDFMPEIRINNASSFEETREIMRQSIVNNVHYDIAFLDLSIDKSNDGFDLIPVIKHIYPSCLVVVVSAKIDIATLNRADQAGASGYIKKPISSFSGRLIEIIKRVVRLRELEQY